MKGDGPEDDRTLTASRDWPNRPSLRSLAHVAMRAVTPVTSSGAPKKLLRCVLVRSCQWSIKLPAAGQQCGQKLCKRVRQTVCLFSLHKQALAPPSLFGYLKTGVQRVRIRVCCVKGAWLKAEGPWWMGLALSSMPRSTATNNGK